MPLPVFTAQEGTTITIKATPTNPVAEPASLPVPAEVPTWSISDSTIATMTVASDGLSATFNLLKSGTTQVDVSAHAIPFGPLFTNSFDVTSTPAPADHFVFTQV